MVSSVSQTWTPDGTLDLVSGRNQATPSLEDDYSILAEGDRVLSCGTGDRFLYRSVGIGERWSGSPTGPVKLSRLTPTFRHASVNYYLHSSLAFLFW